MLRRSRAIFLASALSIVGGFGCGSGSFAGLGDEDVDSGSGPYDDSAVYDALFPLDDSATPLDTAPADDTGATGDSSIDDSPVIDSSIGDGGVDSRAIDTGVDSRPIDTGVDTTPLDSGVDTSTLDSGVDTSVLDSGVDTTPLDTGIDTTPLDTGVDTTPLDTGVDTTPLDTGVDTAPLDTGVDTADTTPPPPPDSGPDTAPPPSHPGEVTCYDEGSKTAVQCDLGSGQTCCGSYTVLVGWRWACSGGGCAFGRRYQCDEKGDCDGGKVCCTSKDAFGTVDGSSCKSSCSDLELCLKTSDCSGGKTCEAYSPPDAPYTIGACR